LVGATNEHCKNEEELDHFIIIKRIKIS